MLHVIFLKCTGNVCLFVCFVPNHVTHVEKDEETWRLALPLALLAAVVFSLVLLGTYFCRRSLRLKRLQAEEEACVCRASGKVEGGAYHVRSGTVIYRSSDV